MTLPGSGGEVRASYQRAARVTTWTLTRSFEGDDPVVAVEGALVDVHPVWITCQPLTLILHKSDRLRWVWRTGVEIVGDGTHVMGTGLPALE